MSGGRGKRIDDIQPTGDKVGFGQGDALQSTPAPLIKNAAGSIGMASDYVAGGGGGKPDRPLPQPQWNHPRYGTCIPGCATYSKCHCGCEGKTNISHKTSAPRSQQRNQPAVFITGHAASVISAAHRESRTPNCHPDREHEARGMCASCYKQWRKNGGERIRIKRIPSKRLNWEALRYKRCLELLFEYGYQDINTVFTILDKELPEEAA